MSQSTWTPFENILVAPSELHSTLSESTVSPRRVVPVAAGRQSGLNSYTEKHIPASVYVSSRHPRPPQISYLPKEGL